MKRLLRWLMRRDSPSNQSLQKDLQIASLTSQVTMLRESQSSLMQKLHDLTMERELMANLPEDITSALVKAWGHDRHALQFSLRAARAKLATGQSPKDILTRIHSGIAVD